MWRIATLLERLDPSGSSLDVCVENPDFENKRDAKTTIGNTLSEGQKQTVRGTITFFDKREPKEITEDFAFIYGSAYRIGEDSRKNYAFARYKPHITIISAAFVNYFSPKTE
jgi:hypothetical protein